MLKVHDQAFAQAPFLHSPIDKERTYFHYLLVLSILILFSFLCYGISAVFHFIVVYTMGMIIVWVHQFFGKSLFYGSSLWKISLLTYFLMLSPDIPILPSLIGVWVLFFLGGGFLCLHQKPIINPTLCALLAAVFLHYSYRFDLLVSLPVLSYALAQKDNLYPNIFSAIVDANMYIAGFPQYSFLSLPESEWKTYYNDTLQQIPQWISWILGLRSIWFGTGFFPLIVLSYFWLSWKKAIDPLLPILYLLSYCVLGSLIAFFTNELYTLEDFFLFMSEGSLWFTAIFLITSPFTLPSHRKGRLVSVVLTAVLTTLLHTRQYLMINFIFAVVLANLFSSLIELLTVSSVWGMKNAEVPYTKRSPEKLIARSGIGIGMILLIVVLMYSLPNDIFSPREQNFYKSLVIKAFPRYTVVSDNTLPQDIYRVVNDKGEERVLLYSQVTQYRVMVAIVVVVNEGIIKDIQILRLSSAHRYNNEGDILKNVIGMEIDHLPQNVTTLVKRQLHSETLTHQLFVYALLQAQQKYQEWNKEES